jgi:hypothetical protein
MQSKPQPFTSMSNPLITVLMNLTGWVRMLWWDPDKDMEMEYDKEKLKEGTS